LLLLPLLSTLRYENCTLFYHEQSIYLDLDGVLGQTTKEGSENGQKGKRSERQTDTKRDKQGQRDRQAMTQR
jgi:hypothetical protein